MRTSTATACCPPVFQTRLAHEAAAELAATFRALADPARLRLLSLIWSQPGAEACVCHLVEPIGLSQPTVSHHLKLLNEAGLLEREKRGAWVYYRVVASRLQATRQGGQAIFLAASSHLQSCQGHRQATVSRG